MDRLALIEQDTLGRKVQTNDLSQQHPDVAVAPQRPADRFGNIGGRQGGGRHLIEQWLEQVVVAPVDDGDLDVGVAELAGAGQTAEAATDDHDVTPGRRSILIRCLKHVLIPSLTLVPCPGESQHRLSPKCSRVIRQTEPFPRAAVPFPEKQRRTLCTASCGWWAPS